MTNVNNKHFRPEHLVAGVSGGLLSVALTHPLELVKVRFQVDDLKRRRNTVNITQQRRYRPVYKGLVDAFTAIYRSDGVRGLYGGVTPSMIGAGSAWGLYFLVFNGLKSRHLAKEGVNRDLTLGEHFLFASQTGLFTLTLTNPIWVAKTRLCLQYEKSMASPLSTSLNDVTSSGIRRISGPSSMSQVLLSLWRTEGVRGLYRGYLPGIVGISHGVVQFVCYEEMKKWYCRQTGILPNSKLGTVEYLAFSSASKLVAASLTYPYQVVRSRLQEQHRQYGGVKDVVLNIVKTEGLYGFYKGLIPCLLRVVPATAITFVTFENVSRFLS